MTTASCVFDGSSLPGRNHPIFSHRRPTRPLNSRMRSSRRLSPRWWSLILLGVFLAQRCRPGPLPNLTYGQPRPRMPAARDSHGRRSDQRHRLRGRRSQNGTDQPPPFSRTIRPPNTWTALAPRPGRALRGRMAPAVINGQLYIAGGNGPLRRAVPNSTLFVFTIRSPIHGPVRATPADSQAAAGASAGPSVANSTSPRATTVFTGWAEFPACVRIPWPILGLPRPSSPDAPCRSGLRRHQRQVLRGRWCELVRAPSAAGWMFYDPVTDTWTNESLDAHAPPERRQVPSSTTNSMAFGGFQRHRRVWFRRSVRSRDRSLEKADTSMRFPRSGTAAGVVGRSWRNVVGRATRTHQFPPSRPTRPSPPAETVTPPAPGPPIGGSAYVWGCGCQWPPGQ